MIDIVRSAAPIFVISFPRSGSTLMRYLLDTHPDVCCPAEVAVGKLCEALSYTLGLTWVEPEAAEDMDVRKARIRASVRSRIEEIMGTYAAAKGKGRWCDRSTNNLEHLHRLYRVFPDAQFVCLYRACMDVVHSVIEMYRFGFPGRLGEAVARASGNVVEAITSSWCEASERMLAFESRSDTNCIRVRYEALVEHPVEVFGKVCGSLGLRAAPEAVTTAFSAPHDPGPGDPKIRFTTRILSNRVGKGATIPIGNVSDQTLTRLNRLQAALGYSEVDRASSVGPDAVLKATSGVFPA